VRLLFRHLPGGDLLHAQRLEVREDAPELGNLINELGFLQKPRPRGPRSAPRRLIEPLLYHFLNRG
jgi:hypothetical protein